MTTQAPPEQRFAAAQKDRGTSEAILVKQVVIDQSFGKSGAAEDEDTAPPPLPRIPEIRYGGLPRKSVDSAVYVLLKI